ncbi:histidine phosphatase superfamily [Pelagophyceae sp. CCMP2097]|nr:histidine phosphatase superfamily [Pelagophyceae sp. CCMP2097]
MLLRARNGARRRPERCGGPGKRRQVSTVILLRHGQSAWNGGVQQQPARFTGWVDVPLTVRGRVEAVAAGQLLRARGYEASKVDVAFTSDLQRAHETCELALASMAGPDQLTWSPDRIRRDGRLNERHYGAVQGKFKNDPALTEKYGFDTVRAWRRSMYGAPPPLLDGDEHFSPLAPATESLADCQKRALHCFDTVIAPALFDEVELPTPPDERTVLIVAHANTIRSLMAHFDAVPEASVPKLHVPNSVPILYHFDQKTRKPHSTKLQSAAGGSHARWLLSPENHAQVRKAVKSGGMLTRALFDSWTDGLRALPGGKASADESDSRALTIAQLEAGLRGLENDPHTDCTVVSVAKKIVRELSYTGRETIALAEFERRATEAAEVLLSRQHIWNVTHDPDPLRGRYF